MQPSARSTLVSLVEEHVTGLVRDAIAVQRHSKRARLHPPPPTAAAANSAGKVAWEDELNRWHHHHHHHVLAVTPEGFVVKSRLHASDINMALQLRGSEKLYATGVVPVPLGASGGGAVSANKDWQQPVQLKDFLRQEAERMPTAPSEMTLRMHWLAVDGMQPEIPENPLPSTVAMTAAPDGSFPGVASTILPVSSSTSATNGSMAVARTDPTSGGTTGLLVHQLQATMLSEELQLYFTRVCLAMERGSATVVTAQQQDAVLQSLQRDAGLQELVPFLVRYAIQELYRLLAAGRMTEHARTMIRMIMALLHNPQLHLELHLQELLPALMTAVVAKQLGKPSKPPKSSKPKTSSMAAGAGTAAGNAASATAEASEATIDAATASNNSGDNNNETTGATVTSNVKKDPAKTASSQNKGRNNGKRTAAAATTSTIGETNSNHWALRREAAVALVRACHLFGTEYPTLKARVLRTLVGALSPSQQHQHHHQHQQHSLPSRYGALVAISLFGPKAVDAFLLPTALIAWQEWEDQLTKRYRRSKQLQQQQQQQRQALLSPVATGDVPTGRNDAEAMDEDKPTEATSTSATPSRKERESKDDSDNNENRNNPNDDDEEEEEEDDAETQHATRMCQQAALHALGIFLQRVSYAEQAARLHNNNGWDDLENALGDRLVALHGAPTDYAMCFV